MYSIWIHLQNDKRALEDERMAVACCQGFQRLVLGEPHDERMQFIQKSSNAL